MIWLHGPAGTGKSAVAQTFAENCLEKGRLGASYFFSRTHDRTEPEPVIPTLVYHLAAHCPLYGSIVANVIGSDLTVLHKTPRIQLRKLIVEPFSLLQRQNHQVTQEPFLVVIDGLDECSEVDAQCEIVEIIGEVIRLKPDLPILWLIASRPEPHLKNLFSRARDPIECNKEELVIDADTRDDVSRYLHDSFDNIRTKFPYVTTTSWPSEKQFQEVADIVSGLFVLASTIIRYVEDSTHADPMKRLVDLVGFMKSTNRIGAKNPLMTLDLVYSQILASVPEDVLPRTMRILGQHVWAGRYPIFSFPAQALCNFLDMDQREFYNALHKLHSVIDIPSPDKAATVSLRPYHASFVDYLRDPARSGRFFVSVEETRLASAKMTLFWYQAALTALPAASDGAS